ncbi:MAG: helix-turn-helix domain-containing protein [Blautia wexlerae]
MRAKEELPECPVATAVSLIGGKWKLLILRNLKERPWRYNELQGWADCFEKVLTDSLRQMMSDGVAYRCKYSCKPCGCDEESILNSERNLISLKRVTDYFGNTLYR